MGQRPTLQMPFIETDIHGESTLRKACRLYPRRHGPTAYLTERRRGVKFNSAIGAIKSVRRIGLPKSICCGQCVDDSSMVRSYRIMGVIVQKIASEQPGLLGARIKRADRQYQNERKELHSSDHNWISHVERGKAGRSIHRSGYLPDSKTPHAIELVGGNG